MPMKRLVFCFDGTLNRLIVENPTNVVLTAESVLPFADDKTAQLIFYDEGVGTIKGERVGGTVFGKGVDKNLADAYRFLIFNYTAGDQIYIFGFSRGAYTARSFAGLLANSSIPNRRHADQVDNAIEHYRAHTDTPEFIERMMQFRKTYCWDVCVSEKEDAWRVAKDPNYTLGKAWLPTSKRTGCAVWMREKCPSSPLDSNRPPAPMPCCVSKNSTPRIAISNGKRRAMALKAIFMKRNFTGETIQTRIAEFCPGYDRGFRRGGG